jgi:hypothetical protein
MKKQNIIQPLRHHLKPLALAACAVVGLATPASAVDWTETKFKATTPVANDKLGIDGLGALDISGNIGIVGGWAAPNPAANAGKAYLFDVTTGSQTVALVPTGGVPASAMFGMGVAIEGNLAVVTARTPGKAYLFDVSTGNPRGVITGGTPGNFGTCAALSGNKLVVGGEDKKIYVYDVTDPDNPFQLGAGPITTAGNPGGFGLRQVALEGNIMVAGAYAAGVNYKGKAWLYDLSTLTAGAGTATETELNPSYNVTGAEQLGYGHSVDIKHGRVIVGALWGGDSVVNGPLWNAGMAFLFDVSTPSSPTKLAEIVPGTRFFNQRFGTDVAISGDTVIIGANTRYASPAVPGEAYLYDITTPGSPTQIQKMTTTGVNWSVNEFGSPVAIDGNVALVGANLDDTTQSNSGAVYIYTGPPPATGYATWAGANSISLIPSEDTNNDGVANGVAYFMDKTGLATNPGINSSGQVTWPNGGNILSGQYGTQFVVQTSSDLQTWTDVASGQLDANTDAVGLVDGSLSYTLTGASPRFVRLKVTPN